MPELHFQFWHWLVFAALLGTVEILAPGVFFLWLALAALATGIIVLIAPEMSGALQIVIFGLLAVVMVFAAWKYIRKNPIQSDQPLLNQRAAQFVGKVYALEADGVRNGTGRVRIGDSTWKVEGPDMAGHTQVRITGYDGSVLTIEKVADATPAGTAPHAPHATDARIDPLKDALNDPLNRSGS